MENILTQLLNNWELICLTITTLFAVTPTEKDDTVMSRIKNILTLITFRK